MLRIYNSSGLSNESQYSIPGSDSTTPEETVQSSRTFSAIQHEIRKLRTLTIEYQDDARFRGRENLPSIEFPFDEAGYCQQVAKLPNQPGLTLQCALEAPLLTSEEEQGLFLRMNYAKKRAFVQRENLQSDSPFVTSEIMNIRADLEQALHDRNIIILANTRLNLAIAQKMQSGTTEVGELFSEGIPPLIRSVDLFNIGMGNKFSTYATWAIRNHFMRYIKLRVRQVSTFTDNGFVGDMRDESLSGEVLINHHKESQELLNILNERERKIVQLRFGFHENGERSLQQVADIIGLSKERVRQILLLALSKMRSYRDGM